MQNRPNSITTPSPMDDPPPDPPHHRPILAPDPPRPSATCASNPMSALPNYIAPSSRLNSAAFGVGQQQSRGAMSLLAWNCQISGGRLTSSTMNHIHRLVTSTKAKVIFISETRNSRFSKTALINHFNVSNAYIVPPQEMSGGLWLLWHHDVDITVESSSQNLILPSCIYK
jgi:hypothetical protein